MQEPDRREHWNSVYRTKSDREVSWYRDHLDNSINLIEETGLGLGAAVIDVGGGSSTLVDDLLERGFCDISVLDISSNALERSRVRLGRKSEGVEWIAADITSADLPEARFDVWHDRAVFHFLTNAGDRKKYVEQVLKSVKPGGHVIVASFGVNGPEKCSGLQVVRYTPESMHAQFGCRFRMLRSLEEIHNTPSGAQQEFVYCHCRVENGD